MHLKWMGVACAALATLALGACAAPQSPLSARLPHDSPLSPRQSPRTPHHVSRRSFFNFQCKGTFDAAIFARLDRICDDCYNLFREAQLYTLCRKECFTTDYFVGCVEVLQEQDELETFKGYIKQLHGADPVI